MNKENMSAKGGSAFGGKIKTILAALFGILFFPVAVLAVDWAAGVTATPGGGVGLNVGVGSSPYTTGAALGVGGLYGGMMGGGWALSNPYGLPQGSLLGIASNLLFWLLALFAIAGILGFVISGIMYLVSTGDDNMITKAKTAMTWSIVGIVVGLAGYIIMQAVASLLSGASNTF